MSNEYQGDNLFRNEWKTTIKNLGTDIEDGAGRVARYVLTVKLVKVRNSDNEDIDNIHVESVTLWGRTKAELLSEYNFELESALPDRAAVLSSLIAYLENE